MHSKNLGRGRRWAQDVSRMDCMSLTSDQMTRMSTSLALDYYCQLGQPSLSTLKLFVSALGQVSFLECVLTVRKVPSSVLPSQVNKKADTPFDLVYCDV